MGDYLPTFTDNEVKNEPMLFSCDRDASIALGGPITKAFLDSLYPEFLNHPDFILDTRVHMLMPGWFPCIPGYHHDDVPRNNTNGQPNYDNVDIKFNGGNPLYGVVLEDGTKHLFLKSHLRSDFSRHE